MPSSKYLHAHIASKPHYKCDQFDFNYLSDIGKPNYLVQTSRPNIIFADHHLARYSADPCKDHWVALMYFGMYLITPSSLVSSSRSNWINVLNAMQMLTLQALSSRNTLVRIYCCQVKTRMVHLLCRMPSCKGIKAANHGHSKHH